MSGLALNRFGQPLDEAADFAENDDAEASGEYFGLSGLSFHDSLVGAFSDLDDTEETQTISEGIVGPHVDLDDPTDAEIIAKFKEAGFQQAQYYGSPESYDQLLEWIEEILSGGALDEPCFAIRISCMTNVPVVMIYEKGGQQFHMETRKLSPELEWRDLNEYLKENHEANLRIGAGDYLADK